MSCKWEKYHMVYILLSHSLKLDSTYRDNSEAFLTFVKNVVLYEI